MSETAIISRISGNVSNPKVENIAKLYYDLQGNLVKIKRIGKISKEEFYKLYEKAMKEEKFKVKPKLEV